MNAVQVLVEPHFRPSQKSVAKIPVLIPSLTKVRSLAWRLHAEGKVWQGEAFGWPAEYQPEINLASAEIEEYDQYGNAHTVMGPFWSPAAFMLGESGVWFYSLSWDNGADKEPVEFIDKRNLVDR